MFDAPDTALGTPGWRPNQGSAYYPDPFLDYASLAMPRSNALALSWSEFLMNTDSTYREATRRTLAYFITSVKIGGLKGEDIGQDEREKYESFFRDVLDMTFQLTCLGFDLLTYGISFSSLYVPFDRYLSCPGCAAKGKRTEVPFRQVAENKRAYHYRWENFGFHLKCPACGYEGDWGDPIDRRTDDSDRFTVKRYRPQDVDVLWSPSSDACRYVWRIPEDERTLIRSGYDHVLEDTPWEIVQAVKENANLKFARGVICCVKEPTLAGVKARGWGVSRLMVNFRHAWYVRLLHRFNEAIALDYIIPLRIVTPDPKVGPLIDGATDPLRTLDLGDWRNQVQQALVNRRFDPLQWSFFPFPLQYQILGGEARQLAPFELLDQATGELLNAAGYPVQFYKMDLTTQSAIPGARLFEANQAPLVHALNFILRFYAKKVSDLLGWEQASARLVPPSYMDDVQSAAAKINLAAQRMVSQTTALEALNLDRKDEQRRIVEEQVFDAELQAKAKEKVDQAALMDAMSAPQQPLQPGAAMGGMPGLPNGQVGAAQGAGTGPNSDASQSFNAGLPATDLRPQTPTEIMSRATSVAQDLMGRTETERSSYLMKLRDQDPVTHAQVKETLDKMRRDARARGGAMLMQQMGGG